MSVTDGNNPFVSIIILNYKRLDALRGCLTAAVSQEYSNREIIVVDNHSEEDVEAVVAAFDGVKLIQLSENGGSCAGRNAGIRAARGAILVTLDNDVEFASPGELRQIVDTFAGHPDVHVLAFQICDAGSGKIREREWCHARNCRKFSDTEFDTFFFGEGASAFRREVFEVAGLYYEPLFIGHEGYDLGLRIIDRGFRILYAPRVRVFHKASAETRTRHRPYYFYTRNYIWIAFKDYALMAGLRYGVPKVVIMFAFSIRARCLGAFFKGIFDGLSGLSAVRSERMPVSRATLAYLADLESWRPSVFSRLARHRSQTQI